ncbi:hypothetical protein ACTORR_13020 [Pseudomonas sp. SAR267]|uniref:hypothetical protein n=1 Tax=Pseudomonas sp. SAR267 TaxID=3454502 RepID=UPI003F9213FF
MNIDALWLRSFRWQCETLCVCLLLVIATILTGCGGDPIADELNKLFPPISADNQRQKAIESTATALAAMGSPNVTAAFSLKELERFVLSDDLKAQGVKAIELSGSEQLVEAKLMFKKKFTEVDAASDPTMAELFKRLQPNLEGTVTAYMTIDGALALRTGSDTKIKLSLLPGVSQIQIEKVELAGVLDVTGAGAIVAAFLNRYRDNLTSHLTTRSFTSVSLPSVAHPIPNPSDVLRISEAGKNVTVTIDAKPPGSPGRIAAIAWLITDDVLATVIEVIPPGITTSPTPEKAIDHTFPAIKGQILGLLKDSFGIEKLDVAANWVAVRKDLIAVTASNLVNQAAACVSVGGTAHQKTATKIPMPSADDVNCTQRSCSSSRECTFEASKDTRDCETCILSRPVLCSPRVCAFGGCVGGGCTAGGCAQRGNDATCEAAKAAQNFAYNIAANAKKTDCDRLKNQEILACQGEALVEKSLCDAGRETLRVIKRASGNFANVDVTTDVNTNDLKVCLNAFNLSPGLDKAALQLHGSGSVTAKVDVDFTPLDIVGHLACQFPWNNAESFTAKLRDPAISFMADIAIRSEPGQALLDFSVQETSLKLEITPSPTEYLVLNPSMMSVSCSGLSLIKPWVVLLTPFLPTLRGEIDHKVPSQLVSIRVPLPQQEINGAVLKTQFKSTAQALLLSASTEEEH